MLEARAKVLSVSYAYAHVFVLLFDQHVAKVDGLIGMNFGAFLFWNPKT